MVRFIAWIICLGTLVFNSVCTPCSEIGCDKINDVWWLLRGLAVSNLMGCVRVKCGFLQGGTVIICLT